MSGALPDLEAARAAQAAQAHGRRPGLGRGRRIAIGIVCAWFVLVGIAHLVFTDVQAGTVPAWVPWPHATLRIGGLLELLGAAGLLLHRTRAAAGLLLFMLTLAATPLQFHLLQNAHLSPVPHWTLLLRLPLQLALLGLIVWSTHAPPRRMG